LAVRGAAVDHPALPDDLPSVPLDFGAGGLRGLTADDRRQIHNV
jgi:hypothetical protein